MNDISTRSRAGGVPLSDYHPTDDDMRGEILAGLTSANKHLPSKYFYDARGSELFDEICALPEYYPTRTETAIMEQYAVAMAEQLGRGVLLIEFGSGSSVKTRILLDNLHELSAYVPVDISREHLMLSASQLTTLYPDLEVLPVCADFTQPFELPRPEHAPKRRVVYFPGSTIGNLDPEPAVALLTRIARLACQGGALLIGVDLKKDRAILERAYNDAAGVTAAFNLNILVRLNRELDGDFDLTAFQHEAKYNAAKGRVEMHLVSSRQQTAHLAGEMIDLAAGERIHTESCYKYTPEEFEELADRAGFAVENFWMDDEQLFSVHYLVCRAAESE
jgi:dimethylhistidine N-methyltransferase